MTVYNLFNNQVNSSKIGWEVKNINSQSNKTTKEIDDENGCRFAYDNGSKCDIGIELPGKHEVKPETD